MLRAGPFSDERIVRLANRRFVPFYFDLSDRGYAGDPDARAFVVKQKPVLGGRGVPTPPVLLMSPESGKVLGEVSNYATEDQVLRTMLDTLQRHPEFHRPGAEEADDGDPLTQARIRVDLHDYAGARKALANSDGDHAQYLLGHIARLERDWKAMERHLARVKEPDLADDVAMERAHGHWHRGEYEKLQARVKGIAKESNRYTEARYYEGLSHFHRREKEKALAIWSSTIKACGEDPWVYRADWAYCGAKQKGKRRAFSSAGPRTSCLNRIGYMGRRNPDLDGPR